MKEKLAGDIYINVLYASFPVQRAATHSIYHL